MDKEKIQEHLAEADRHIEKGNERISRQEELIKELAVDSHEIAIAKKTLENFEKVEKTMEGHRDLIRQELEEKESNNP